MPERYIIGGKPFGGSSSLGPVIVYSEDDGTTAASASSPWDSHFSSFVRDIAVGPSNKLVAVGSNDGFSQTTNVMSSSDGGLTWSDETEPDFHPGWSIRYMPSLSLWVMDMQNLFSGGFTTYSSPDLTTWTYRANNFDTTNSNSDGGFIDVGNGVLMMTGRNSTPDRWVARTTDLSTWTYPSSMTISVPRHIRYLNGSWFVCGRTGTSTPKLFESTDDGVTWSDITPGSLTSVTTINDIAYNGTTYSIVCTATGGSDQIYTSSNLSSWTSRSSASAPKPYVVAYAKPSASPAVVWAGVDSGVSPNNVVWHSLNDGTTWGTTVTDLDGGSAFAITSVPFTVAGAGGPWRVSILTGRS